MSTFDLRACGQPCADIENARNVPIDHRHGPDFKGVHADSLLGRQRVHQRRFTGHRDIVRDFTDGQGVGPAYALRRTQRDPFAFVCLEAPQSDFQCVGSYGHVIEDEFTRLPGKFLRDVVGALVNELHLGSR